MNYSDFDPGKCYPPPLTQEEYEKILEDNSTPIDISPLVTKLMEDDYRRREQAVKEAIPQEIQDQGTEAIKKYIEDNKLYLECTRHERSLEQSVTIYPLYTYKVKRYEQNLPQPPA